MSRIRLPRNLRRRARESGEPLRIKCMVHRRVYRNGEDCLEKTAVEERKLKLQAMPVDVLEVVGGVPVLVVQHQHEVEGTSGIIGRHSFQLFLDRRRQCWLELPGQSAPKDAAWYDRTLLPEQSRDGAAKIAATKQFDDVGLDVYESYADAPTVSRPHEETSRWLGAQWRGHLGPGSRNRPRPLGRQYLRPRRGNQPRCVGRGASLVSMVSRSNDGGVERAVTAVLRFRRREVEGVYLRPQLDERRHDTARVESSTEERRNERAPAKPATHCAHKATVRFVGKDVDRLARLRNLIPSPVSLTRNTISRELEDLAWPHEPNVRIRSPIAEWVSHRDQLGDPPQVRGQFQVRQLFEDSDRAGECVVVRALGDVHRTYPELVRRECDRRVGMGEVCQRERAASLAKPADITPIQFGTEQSQVVEA